jgi:AcrR family transcriptional regulator
LNYPGHPREKRPKGTRQTEETTAGATKRPAGRGWSPASNSAPESALAPDSNDGPAPHAGFPVASDPDPADADADDADFPVASDPDPPDADADDADPSSFHGDTAERLLEAGRHLFAKAGFEGTSIRALTHEAGANLGAVTYHFETKEAFYQAVLERVLKPVRDRVRMLREAPLPAPQRLELFVQGLFAHLKEYGDVPRFMAQEVVLGDYPSPQILKTVGTVVGTLADIMKDGQEEGTIVPGDPVLMALTLLSQPIYLFLMPKFLGREDLKDAGLPQPTGSSEEHVLAFVRRAFFVSKEGS